MLYNTVLTYVMEAAKAGGYPIADTGRITVEHPSEQFGDFATNVALVLAKEKKENPITVAKVIAEQLEQYSEFASVSIAGPGFINMTFRADFLEEYLRKRVCASGWGNHTTLRGKRVVFEYTDPNPFKELHIGHLMSNSIGESLSRIAETLGASVKRVCYQGDVGLHVAKAVWALRDMDMGAITKESLGKAYATGATAYDTNGTAKKEIETINQQIYEGTDEHLSKIYEKGKQVSLDAFDAMYARIGTQFDRCIFESETMAIGKQLVEQGLETGVFERNNEAVVFHGGNYDKHLHTRVFLSAKGLPTYETKELGLGVLKEQLFHPDESYIVTAAEIMHYMLVVRRAAQEMNLDFIKHTHHLPHGLLKLTTGKMSSRTGDVVTAESLVNELREHIRQQSKAELTPEESDVLAVAAIRYTVLKQGTGRDVVLDPEQSISLQGDSGPYLLYSFVRLQSILQKRPAQWRDMFRSKELFQHPTLLRLLYRYEEVVLRAWETKESNHITTYLTKLASEIHSWYAKEKILGSPDEFAKIQLVRALAGTLKHGLHLLGIATVQKM